MALMGTEDAIKCPDCGSIEFIETTIVKFHEGLTIGKLQALLAVGRRAPLRNESFSYVCKICGRKME